MNFRIAKSIQHRFVLLETNGNIRRFFMNGSTNKVKLNNLSLRLKYE